MAVILGSSSAQLPQNAEKMAVEPPAARLSKAL
jgi:hypothetical protein